MYSERYAVYLECTLCWELCNMKYVLCTIFAEVCSVLCCCEVYSVLRAVLCYNLCSVKCVLSVVLWRLRGLQCYGVEPPRPPVLWCGAI